MPRATERRTQTQSTSRGRRSSQRRNSTGRRRRRSRAKRRPNFMPVVLAVILVVALAYLGLCVKASTTKKIYPNTRILGVNVGGTTLDEVTEILSETVQDTYAGQSITIQVGEQTVSVALSELIHLDSEQAAEAAYAAGRQGGALTSGLRYIKAMVVGCKVDISQEITFSNLDSVYDALQAQLATLDEAVVPSSYQVTDEQLILTKGISGQAVDTDALKSDILEALETGDYTTPIECPITVTTPDTLDIQAIYEEIYTEPVSAYCDDEANVVEDVVGVSFDLSAAQERFQAAAEGDSVAVELVFTDADVTAAELSELLFRDVLGTASSNVGGTSARISNVKLAASFVDGTILNPGESFSYNDTVGERTEERGFQAAAAYSGGETVQEVGGGICQVSSTIYLATLRADLEIVERRNHTYICSYMPYGEDATVSWGGPDFVFKNDTDYPIKILVSYSGGVLTATVYGTNLTGKYVEITNEVTSTTSYETIYQDTTELSAGETQVKTSGYNGMTVKVYRNVYSADGSLISSTLESNNTYQVRNKVILRGVSTVSEETTATESPTASETPTESTEPESPTPSPSEENPGEEDENEGD